MIAAKARLASENSTKYFSILTSAGDVQKRHLSTHQPASRIKHWPVGQALLTTNKYSTAFPVMSQTRP